MNEKTPQIMPGSCSQHVDMYRPAKNESLTIFYFTIYQ